MADVTTMVFRM